MNRLGSYTQGEWFVSSEAGRPLFNAVTGEQVAEVSSAGLDFAAMREYAIKVGGPALQKMTFHERARMLKAIAKYLMDRKEELYELSYLTGATRADSWIDIEGGISTFFVYSGKGRRELPDQTFHIEGAVEPLSKDGDFIGRHICVPKPGVAIHINAFNFPCWGMLEKLAPTFLAGMPAIVKPASVSCFLAEKLVRMIVESNLLPTGALQLISGGVGDLLEHVECQDVVTFTGSAVTGLKIRSHPKLLSESVPFNMEADSLNCCILGKDAKPDSPEFTFFIKEVAREICVKAGQKCTAIRRAIVPSEYVDDVQKALVAQLKKYPAGDPRLENVRLGALASKDQQSEVRERLKELSSAAELVYDGSRSVELHGADMEQGAFFGPSILYCRDPLGTKAVHEVEAFGPVTTIMPYSSGGEAVEIANQGEGSLVGSLFTADTTLAKEIVLGVAPYHGRLLVVNTDCAKASTGHGSPMPHLVHGGPGRAGGGEEMGGVRAVMHYMQRTALQGHPTMLTDICGQWMRGAARHKGDKHPFRKYFEEISVGECLESDYYTVTDEDVRAFAELSGDKFYAHMDDDEARKGIFDARVAHGYFIVSKAAGLFVDPDFGPVLANYGLEDLRFIEPVYLNDKIKVFLTCAQKVYKEKRDDEEFANGVVYWDVEIVNQDNNPVALYTILTLVRRKAN